MPKQTPERTELPVAASTTREHLFRSIDGREIHVASMKRTVEQGGILYLRVPRPKQLSRAARASNVVTELEAAADDLDEIKNAVEELEDELNTIAKDDPENSHDAAQEELKAQIQEKLEEAISRLDSVDLSELEALTEEMTSWRDNMSGTALENTGKFQEVEEAASTLEGIDSNPGGISEADDIGEAADELRDKASELEGVSFPGMY